LQQRREQNGSLTFIKVCPRSELLGPASSGNSRIAVPQGHLAVAIFAALCAALVGVSRAAFLKQQGKH